MVMNRPAPFTVLSPYSKTVDPMINNYCMSEVDPETELARHMQAPASNLDRLHMR
jgi:hypothetical protein